MMTREFKIDVDPELQENAVYCNYEFICLADDSDGMLKVFNYLNNKNKKLMKENKELKQNNRQLSLIGEQQSNFIQSKGYTFKELVDFVRDGSND